MTQRNPTQGGAAGDIRPVAVGLNLDLRLPADLPEESGGNPVGTVAQSRVVLEYNALPHHRGVGRVRQFRVVGMDGVSVVRGNQEGLGKKPIQIPIHTPADSAQGVLQEGGACPLDGAGTYLLAVKYAQHRNLRRVKVPVQEALGAAPGAFQIVQSRGGQVFLSNSPDGSLLPDVQVQIVTQNFSSGLLLQKRLEFSGVLLAAGEGQGVHRRIPFVAVVDLPVHMNGHVGNQQQIPVDVHQSGLDAAVRLHRHPAGYGQRPIQPGEEQLTAVTLHRHPVIGAGELKILLDLEAGAVGVAGAHQEASGVFLRNPESDQRGTAPIDIVLPSAPKLPIPVLGQALIAGRFQLLPQPGLGMVNAVGCVQKRAQIIDPIFQFGSSFALFRSIPAFFLFYTRTASPSTGEI